MKNHYHTLQTRERLDSQNLKFHNILNTLKRLFLVSCTEYIRTYKYVFVYSTCNFTYE